MVALAALLGTLVVAGCGDDRTSSTAPVLVSGTLTDAGGKPVDGTVVAYWSQPGARLKDVVVASTTTDSSGRFTLRAAPSSRALKTALAAADVNNGGWINLNLYAVSGKKSVYTAITRKLVDGDWRSNSMGPQTVDFTLAPGAPGFTAGP